MNIESIVYALRGNFIKRSVNLFISENQYLKDKNAVAIGQFTYVRKPIFRSSQDFPKSIGQPSKAVLLWFDHLEIDNC